MLCSLLFGHVSVPACGADHDAALMLPCCAGAVGWACPWGVDCLDVLKQASKLASGGGSSCLSGCLGSPLLGDLGMLCHHERVQPACEQSLRTGHTYTATLDQQGSGGLGLRSRASYGLG